MDQELIAAEIQALLTSLKSSLSDRSTSVDSMRSDPAGAVTPDTPHTPQLSRDLLPDHRVLRRFLLMV